MTTIKVWSFLDYISYGIPKGMYQGYMERAAKQNDSWNDMLNFGTFGVTGMIQGAFNPNNAWSKEHWANMIRYSRIIWRSQFGNQT